MSITAILKQNRIAKVIKEIEHSLKQNSSLAKFQNFDRHRNNAIFYIKNNSLHLNIK